MQRASSDDLIALARSTRDNREATLLRATTALFCQEPTHDRDSIRRYEQLATYFLPSAAEPDRAYVASILSGRADAPPAVMRLLARDVITVAAPALMHSMVLSTIDLLGVIASTGPEHHRLIAYRPNLPDVVLQALTVASEARAQAGPTPATADAPPGPPAEDDTNETLARFLELPSSARLRIIGHISTRRSAVGGGAPRPLESALRHAYASAEIVVCARAGSRPGLVKSFAAVLDIDADLVEQLLDDPSGEPLVLMIKAAGLTQSDGRTVLLLANPDIGQSVERFFRLADLYASVEPGVAESFIAAWRGRNAWPAVHVPAFADIGDRPLRPAERPAPVALPAPLQARSA